MGNAVEQSVDEIILSRKKAPKWYKNWKIVTLAVVLIVSLILGSISYYQANHFNSNISINSVNVSGLTSNEALDKLQNSVLTNEIYVGDQQVLDGKDTKMAFVEADLQEVKKLQKRQWTFFPSFKEKNFSLIPSNQDQYRSQTLKNEFEQTLAEMNKDLKAPVDAKAILEEGKITISTSIAGTQFNISNLLAEYDKHDYNSEIRLNPIYIQPIREDDETVIKEQNKLQELLDHSVEYKVQDKIHTLKGADLIKSASVSNDLKITIHDQERILNKIAEINDSQSTLGKEFTFKTHSGAVKKVKAQGYGWALDVEKEAVLIHEAFEKGEKSVTASNIHGNGWSGEGYGYDTTTNNGIGDTYAEVSINEQRIWIYKDGKQVLSTHVVTGKHSTGEDTSKGVWYILYKRTPYTLTGSAVGNPNYSIQVDYWAPFTNSGQGFHDASWRGNWNSNAYLTAGSGGCVNVPPSVMKAVYDNLSTYDPVVIY